MTEREASNFQWWLVGGGVAGLILAAFFVTYF